MHSHAHNPTPACQRALEVCARSHRYRFVWTEGDERDVLGVVRTMADDPREALDWFDAALIAYELSRTARREPSTSLRTTPPARRDTGDSGPTRITPCSER